MIRPDQRSFTSFRMYKEENLIAKEFRKLNKIWKVS